MGRGGTSTLFGSLIQLGVAGATQTITPISLEGFDAPATTSSTTYAPVIWSSATFNTIFLGTTNAVVAQASLVVDEIMA